jgi:hypothetical protein
MSHEEEDTYLDSVLGCFEWPIAPSLKLKSRWETWGMCKCQKRPTMEAKETYCRGKIDLVGKRDLL